MRWFLNLRIASRGILQNPLDELRCSSTLSSSSLRKLLRSPKADLAPDTASDGKLDGKLLDALIHFLVHHGDTAG